MSSTPDDQAHAEIADAPVVAATEPVAVESAAPASTTAATGESEQSISSLSTDTTTTTTSTSTHAVNSFSPENEAKERANAIAASVGILSEGTSASQSTEQVTGKRRRKDDLSEDDEFAEDENVYENNDDEEEEEDNHQNDGGATSTTTKTSNKADVSNTSSNHNSRATDPILAGITAENVKRKRIPLPTEPSDINYGSLLMGPKGTYQKSLEADTGCKIVLRGKGIGGRAAAIVLPGDETEGSGDNEEPHVVVVADSEEKLAKGEAIITKLFTDHEYALEMKRVQLQAIAAEKIAAAMGGGGGRNDSNRRGNDDRRGGSRGGDHGRDDRYGGSRGSGGRDRDDRRSAIAPRGPNDRDRYDRGGDRAGNDRYDSRRGNDVGGRAPMGSRSSSAIGAGGGGGSSGSGSGSGGRVVEGSHQDIFGVPQVSAGAVIGKGGDTIRDLQSRTNTRIQIQPTHEVRRGATERVITITGTPAAVAEAKRLVWLCIEKDQLEHAASVGARGASSGGSGGADRGGGGDRGAHSFGGSGGGSSSGRGSGPPPGGFSVSIAIPDDRAGAVIGKGGATIRTLQQNTGTHVNVPKESDPANSSVRTVTITAPSREQCDQAYRQIQDVLAAEATRLVSSGGGAGGGGGGGGGHYPPSSHQLHHHSQQQHHQQQASMGDNSTHLQVVISDKAAGIVIGRQGASIRELQERTGCRIHVPTNPDPSTQTRTVEIKGTPQAVEFARQEVLRLIASAPPSGGVGMGQAPGGGGGRSNVGFPTQQQFVPPMYAGQQQQQPLYGAVGAGYPQQQLGGVAMMPAAPAMMTSRVGMAPYQQQPPPQQQQYQAASGGAVYGYQPQQQYVPAGASARIAPVQQYGGPSPYGGGVPVSAAPPLQVHQQHAYSGTPGAALGGGGGGSAGDEQAWKKYYEDLKIYQARAAAAAAATSHQPGRY